MSRNNERQWMPFYFRDYFEDTAHLSDSEHVAYIRLMGSYWEKLGLPNDDRQVSYIAQLRGRRAKQSLATLKLLFSPSWTHKRIDKELAKIGAIAEKRAAVAKERWAEKREIFSRKANKNSKSRMQLHKSGNGCENAAPEADIVPKKEHNLFEKAQQNQQNADAIACHIYTKEESTSDLYEYKSSVVEPERDALRAIPKEKGMRKMRKVKLRSQIPPDALPSDSQLEAGRKVGMNDDTLEHEWLQFRSHHLARGTLFANWDAAFLNWSLRWASFGCRQIGTAPRSNRNPALELYEKELEYERRTGRNFYTDPDNPSLAELFKH